MRWRRRPRRAELIAELTAELHRVEIALMEARAELEMDARATRDRLSQQRQDMRAAQRAAIEAAYEPVEVGDCTKIRYTRREDAEQHAMEIAIRYPGSVMNAYQCRTCPPYILTGQRPWHAGHARSNRRTGAMWADETTVYHAYGCQFRINDDGPTYYCEAHRYPAEEVG